MSWSNKHKTVCQIYRRAARLTDFEYRELLFRHTQQRSSTAACLDDDDYDMVMAEIEEILCQRLLSGEADDNGIVNPLDYFRTRCADGRATSRQLRTLRAMTADLRRLAPWPGNVGVEDYLIGIAAKAGHRVKYLRELERHEASRVIEALKARLRQVTGHKQEIT